MTRATQIVSPRVVVGMAAERLGDVALRMKAKAAHHCVVHDPPGRFLGVIRLVDVAGFSNPGNRILADLVARVPPLYVREEDPAAEVIRLFVHNRVHEAVVLSQTGDYVGLITAESAFDWLAAQEIVDGSAEPPAPPPVSPVRRTQQGEAKPPTGK